MLGGWWGWAELSGFIEGSVGCRAKYYMVRSRGGGRPRGEEEEPFPFGATELLDWIKQPHNFIHHIDFMVSLKSFDTSLHGFPADYWVTVSELKTQLSSMRMTKSGWQLSDNSGFELCQKESEEYSRWMSVLKYQVFLFTQLPSVSSYLRSSALTRFWDGVLIHVRFLSCQTSLSLFSFWEIFEQRRRNVIECVSETNKMERMSRKPLKRHLSSTLKYIRVELETVTVKILTLCLPWGFHRSCFCFVYFLHVKHI